MSFWLRHRIFGKMCFVHLQDGRISYKYTLKRLPGKNSDSLKVDAARSSETSGLSYTPTRSQNPEAYNLSRPTFVRFTITVMYFSIVVYRMYSAFTVLLIKCDTDHAPRWDGNLVIPGPILPKYHLFR